MSRRQKKSNEQVELDITTFLNLMVVLIPFLLATAVFSKITIQELNLPQGAAAGQAPDKPVFTIEVMIRKEGLEIGDGKRINSSIPKKDGKYDLEELSKELRVLKSEHPDKEDVTVLLESDIEYENMIAVMDAVKSAKIPVPGQEEPQIEVLFPEISIGDAP